MAYFKDLTRYEYSKNLFRCVGEPLNVGWLERCATYQKGVVSPDLTAKLLALCKFPVNSYRGFHGCHFCTEHDDYSVRVADSEGEFRLGQGEIRVPAKDGKVTYVAPNLIYHYVVVHQYQPPDLFLEALRNLSIPNPAVVSVLQWIEFFQNQPAILSNLLEESLRLETPSIPPEIRGVVVEAANELKILESHESDARARAENIANRLKSVLARAE